MKEREVTETYRVFNDASDETTFLWLFWNIFLPSGNLPENESVC